jgi:DNA-binding response OmpR family regulator
MTRKEQAMRVLLATDQPDLGHALSLFLSEQSIQVVDVDGDSSLLLVQAKASRPDAVLVDWSLGEAVSSQVVADFMDCEDPTPVIILSTPRASARARICAAAAYATCGDQPDELLATLADICARPAGDAGAPAG